jgi:hypothetical protein
MGDGTAKCWGRDAFGELGDGQQTAIVPVPTSVAGLADVKALAAGGTYTCALKADGTVACWGGNVSCQIGDGCALAGIAGDQSSALAVLAPTAVTGLTGPATAIQASSLGGRDGLGFTCALLSDGTIECWGDNLLGLGGSELRGNRADGGPRRRRCGRDGYRWHVRVRPPIERVGGVLGRRPARAAWSRDHQLFSDAGRDPGTDWGQGGRRGARSTPARCSTMGPSPARATIRPDSWAMEPRPARPHR